ncbi:MAG: FG-GAP-like repeat-containing protein [Gemmataceae bacterium]|nr:FG-GAP-like repeat-containing protein [Gemmataceae bacterium]
MAAGHGHPPGRRGRQPGHRRHPGLDPAGRPGGQRQRDQLHPPFPAYVSGHAVFGAAAFRAIANFYGTDAIPFTFVSDEFNGITRDQNGEVRPLRPRSFETLSQAAAENARSRIYLGIHWAFDASQGIALGNRIADAMSANFLLPVPDHRRYAVGAGAGGGSRVRLMDSATGRPVLDTFAFPGFSGGARVAAGDVTGDGVPDLVAGAGAGGGPHVKVFDGATGEVVRSLLAFAPDFRGGVWVSTGDVDGDGVAEVVVGAGEGGGPHVKVFGRDGAVVRELMAFDPGFRGGARVAAGDVDGDGLADLVVGAGLGGTAHVKVFDGATGAEARSFLADAPSLADGVYVAAGDVDGNGRADIVTGAGGSNRVQVFAGGGEVMQSFAAFAPSVRPATGGVRVGAADVDGDGRADLLTAAGPGDAPVVECRNATDLAQLERMYAFEPEFLGGVHV